MGKINRTRQSRNTVRRRTNRTQTTRRKSRGRKVTGRKSRGRKVTGRKVTGRKVTGRKVTGRKSTRYRGGEGGKCKNAWTKCQNDANYVYGRILNRYGLGTPLVNDAELRRNKTRNDCDTGLKECRHGRGWAKRIFTANPEQKARDRRAEERANNRESYELHRDKLKMRQDMAVAQVNAGRKVRAAMEEDFDA
jgi:hypothetical protein